jgi:hypothetical protein
MTKFKDGQRVKATRVAYRNGLFERKHPQCLERSWGLNAQQRIQNVSSGFGATGSNRHYWPPFFTPAEERASTQRE